jgi:hypothetical protein
MSLFFCSNYEIIKRRKKYSFSTFYLEIMLIENQNYELLSACCGEPTDTSSSIGYEQVENICVSHDYTSL